MKFIALTILIASTAQANQWVRRPSCASLLNKDLEYALPDLENQRAKQIFAEVNAYWAKRFAEYGKIYRPARYNLYRERVDSTCVQNTNILSFYCAPDSTVYLDVQRLKRSNIYESGPFGLFLGYAIAHEIAHHVQSQLESVAQLKSSYGDSERGDEFRRLQELQADCLAGVVASASGWLGLNDSGAMLIQLWRQVGRLGDDYLQAKAKNEGLPLESGGVHGTSEQRMGWFARGATRPHPANCEPFRIPTLY
jgi:hypothetical protein